MSEFNWEQNFAARQAAEEETNRKAESVDTGRQLVRENSGSAELLKTAEELLAAADKEYEDAKANVDAIIASGQQAVAEHPEVVMEAYGEYLKYLNEKIEELSGEQARVQDLLMQDGRVPENQATLSPELVQQISKLGGTPADRVHFENRAKRLVIVFTSRSGVEQREAEELVLEMFEKELLDEQIVKQRLRERPKWA